ncbi:hypothetical protein Hoch_3721 [Haliangium ochraceum DSM 14365]|uniref:(2Fe-2S) ferredoxin domain-containing protein n=2 Tax=Haliangium ochraceum TaxID=80816 RepID=D0LY71_HALO1|nr:hypothetical protein Hoch_3721 [Haliangium ochraceum DSM 14365]
MRFEIRVCSGPYCAGLRDADAVSERFTERIAESGRQERAEVQRWRCFGRCMLGPNVHVRDLQASAAEDGDPPRRVSALYHGVSRDDVDEILEKHVDRAERVSRLLSAQRQPPAQPPASQVEHRLAARGRPPAAEPASAAGEREDTDAARGDDRIQQQDETGEAR